MKLTNNLFSVVTFSKQSMILFDHNLWQNKLQNHFFCKELVFKNWNWSYQYTILEYQTPAPLCPVAETSLLSACIPACQSRQNQGKCQTWCYNNPDSNSIWSVGWDWTCQVMWYLQQSKSSNRPGIRWWCLSDVMCKSPDSCCAVPHRHCNPSTGSLDSHSGPGNSLQSPLHRHKWWDSLGFRRVSVWRWSHYRRWLSSRSMTPTTSSPYSSIHHCHMP